MSKDRKTRDFDFIDQYDARLNLIYRQWEEQIAIQSAANKSKSLFVKALSTKKSLIAKIAIALGSSVAAIQYSSARMTDNLIHANSHKINTIAEELNSIAIDQYSSYCVSDNHIYELASGRINHLALSNQPREFISQANTLSLIRHSKITQKPDAYLRLNPYYNLLFSSIEETNSTLNTESSVVGLKHNQKTTSDRNQVVNVQTKAINLNAEFNACLYNYQDIILPQPNQYSD